LNVQRDPSNNAIDRHGLRSQDRYDARESAFRAKRSAALRRLTANEKAQDFVGHAELMRQG
jgi:hypothetical protein